MSLDDEDKMNQMCPKCQDEATSHNKCTRCGTSMSTDGGDHFVNPNFDKEKFDRLSREDDIKSPNMSELDD